MSSPRERLRNREQNRPKLLRSRTKVTREYDPGLNSD